MMSVERLPSNTPELSLVNAAGFVFKVSDTLSPLGSKTPPKAADRAVVPFW